MKKTMILAFALMIGSMATLTGCSSTCSKDKAHDNKDMAAEMACPAGCTCAKCAAM